MNGSYLDVRYLFVVCLVFFLVSCGGGSSGGGGSSSYPTPTLPAGARTISDTNANATADSAVAFVTTLSDFTELKTEDPPTMAQVVDRVVDQVIRRNRITGSQNAYKTEDLSSLFCVSGTVIADYDETPTSEAGTITFTNCEIDSTIFVDGTLVYDSSWNDTTLDYRVQVGGTLTFDIETESVTIVMNQIESGNDSTGDFSTNISFSLAGIPDGGYLVTTTQDIVVNTSGTVSGELIVAGSANTRLRLTIIGPSSASVELDDGSGTFVSCAVIAACTSPVFFSTLQANR